MTDQEKIGWLGVLLALCAGPLWFAAVLGGVLGAAPEGQRGDTLVTLGWIALISTAAYLLILSWRAAYLSGRKKR